MRDTQHGTERKFSDTSVFWTVVWIKWSKSATSITWRCIVFNFSGREDYVNFLNRDHGETMIVTAVPAAEVQCNNIMINIMMIAKQTYSKLSPF